MWATSGDDDYVGSHHTAPDKEQKKQFHDDVSKTVSPNHDLSTAFDETLETYRIDEPLWAYIQFIDPQSHWDKKLTVLPDEQQSSEVVELIGSSADIDRLKRFCDIHRLKRAVKREKLRTKSNSDDECQFCTPMSKLMVKVITGDLLAQRCEILVNPSNSNLGHRVGLSKLLAEAAGPEMERECREYLNKHYMLKTSMVLDTTAGRMKPPVRRIIHACGPNIRETSDMKKCEELLEQTFFHCFILANDKQHAHSIAVPAISSGLPRLFLRLQPELKLGGVMDLISRNLLSSVLLL